MRNDEYASLKNAYSEMVASDGVSMNVKKDLRKILLKKGVYLPYASESKMNASESGEKIRRMSRFAEETFSEIDASCEKEAIKSKLLSFLKGGETAKTSHYAAHDCGNFAVWFYRTLLYEYWTECYDEKIKSDFIEFLEKFPDANEELKERGAVLIIWEKMRAIQKEKGELVFPDRDIFRREFWDTVKAARNAADHAKAVSSEDAEEAIRIIRKYFDIYYS